MGLLHLSRRPADTLSDPFRLGTTGLVCLSVGTPDGRVGANLLLEPLVEAPQRDGTAWRNCALRGTSAEQPVDAGERLPEGRAAGQFDASSMMGFTPMLTGCPGDIFVVAPLRSLESTY
jgi:hypothetical protein